MTKIKICGVTNYEDAQNAADLGADFLGFNFYNKSSRYIDYRKANDIIGKLKGKISIVGVFVNESMGNVKKADGICNLDLIQLSGDENDGDIIQLKKITNKKIIKTFRIKNKIDADLINSFDSDYIMLDSFKDGIYGGTGKSFDLGMIKNIDNKRLFLAGGMDKDNVKSAIEKLNPYAIDACSSTESSPGKKDFGKMKQLIEAVQ